MGKPGAVASSNLQSPDTKAPKAKKQRPVESSAQLPPKSPAEREAEAVQPAKKARHSEIDDIFGSAKNKKALSVAEKVDEQVAKEGVKGKSASQQDAPRITGNKDDLFGADDKKKRKRTEEGYCIYGEDELGLNIKGGNTDLCPFDCNCCF